MRIRTKCQGPTTRKCPSGKLRYRDHRQAIKALHSVQRSRDAQLRRVGVTRRAECRAYECFACKGWHLTSQR